MSETQNIHNRNDFDDGEFAAIDAALGKSVINHISRLAQFYVLGDYAHDWVLFHKSLKDWPNFMERYYDKLDDEQQEAAMTYFLLRMNVYYKRIKDRVLPALIKNSNNEKLLNFIRESQDEIKLFEDYENAQLQEDRDVIVKFGKKLINQILIADKYQTYAWQQNNSATKDF